MPQTPDTPSILEYDRTLVVAIELSSKCWVLAAQVPGLPHAKAQQTVKPTVEALMAAIDGYRSRAATVGRIVERVIATYEAGWSGFLAGPLAVEVRCRDTRYPALQCTR